jgi:sigma-B regulation protein RsbU (phosphoserine phosphatase)
VARAPHPGNDGRLLPSGSASRGALIRFWVTRTFSGRAIVGGAALKAVAWLLRLLAMPVAIVELLDTLGDLAVVAGALVVGFRLFVDVKRRLLWRVSRKLTVSYIFIGFVPALLIIVFFLVSGLLLFFNFASYMTRQQFDAMVDQARFVAESAAFGVQRNPVQAAEVLAARQTVAAAHYPGTSISLVPGRRACGDAGGSDLQSTSVGPWAHVAVPDTLPDWIGCSGQAGLIAYQRGDATRLAARATVWPSRGTHAVVVDIPLDDVFAREVREKAGVVLGPITPFTTDTDSSDPGIGVASAPSMAIRTGGSADAPGILRWWTFLAAVDWRTGATLDLVVDIGTSLRDIYQRISIAPASRTADPQLGQWLIIALAAIGVMFLIIQVVAFSMGLALARSITGSVHELFAGTERVRRGDFTGRIAIRSRDQLGELSDSFNSMTASIEDLLHQKAEKERLEQELRIARSIQMSLLPQGPMTLPGVSLTAHCEPAREVGGDYYDFLPINEHTIGILVADVSGKGTSAALYMAELKGVVLSLSQRHTSPRELLIEADRIISRHLDSRSFITVSYLVIDLRAATLRYARAGHCPLIYVPGPHASSRAPRLLAPDGMVLGLQLDEGRTFTRLLEEVTLPLAPGDVFLMYTDGISEAMNVNGECFGDVRLADLVGQHADLPSDELRERILRDIGAFAGSAAQQDDMTMVLLRVDEIGLVKEMTA